MKMLYQLASIWRDEAATHRTRYKDEARAAMLELAARELEARLRDYDEENLSLSEAADVSGYSYDHIGRLVRTGQIPNAGCKNAPRIRRKDLPRKARLDARRRQDYDIDGLFRDITTSKEMA